MSDELSKLDGVRALFVTELSGHLDALGAALMQPAQPFSEKVRAGIENRFHVLRGGAGFLQLVDLRQVAELGEREFRAARSDELFASALATLEHKLLPALRAELNKLSSAENLD